MDQERTTGHAAAGRWELYHEARRTMIGSVWGSGSQSFRTILASSWGLVSFRGSRQTKMNHDWISLWITFSIIWDNFGVNVEPFLVPKIARGPPCRPLRRPRHHPMGPGTSQEHPYGSHSGPRGAPRMPNGVQMERPRGAKQVKETTQKVVRKRSSRRSEKNAPQTSRTPFEPPK